MRVRRAVTATAVAAVLGASWALAPDAAADYPQYAMNGTYSVVSNGEWARMNDRYEDKPSVRSTWTVNSTCTTAYTCLGKVTSSLGWTEDVYTGSGNMWYVKHFVTDWIPCPDGTTGPGLQIYKFQAVTEEGLPHAGSDLWVGQDETTGRSGACGRNRSLVLNLPVKLTKVT